MAYIGRDLDKGNYLKLDDLSSQFNGSTVTFNLTSGGQTFYPGSAFSILISLGGVIQEPESAYQINQNQITFAQAPLISDDFFCIVLGVALGIGVPGEGTVSGSKLTKPFNYDSGLLYLDDTNNRVGINTLSPQAPLHLVGSGSTTLLVDGSINATSYYGDASNLTGIPAGLGTALSQTQTSPLNKLYFTDTILSVGSTITVNPPNSSNIAYTQYSEIAVAENADLIVEDGDDLIVDILGLSTATASLLFGAGGRVRADNFTNKAGTGAPTFPSGINVVGVVTATSFSGSGANLTGISSVSFATTSFGLSGTPNVTVGTIGATSLNASGIVTASSFSGSGANLTGVVPTAITVANEASDTTCFPAFFTAATGNLGPKTNTGLTFNSATGALAVTGAISASTNAIFGGTTILTPNSRGATVNIGTNASGQSAELLLGHQGDGFSLITGGGSGFGELSIMKSTTSIAAFNSSGLAVTGTISATTGMAVGGATAGSGGVAFPATAVAVSDANTLDDYEEGTWSPGITFGGAAVGMTVTTSGGYTKVGNLVTVTFQVTFSAKGSSTGSMTISGLPFNAGGSNMQLSGFGYMHRIASAQTAGQIYCAPDGANFSFRFVGYSSGNTTGFTNSDIADTTDIRGGITYRI